MITGELSIREDEYFINSIPVDKKTIGQSTGLKDKYNQEIFINDIIHFKANYGDFTLELATATVGFDELNGRLAVKMNDNVLALLRRQNNTYDFNREIHFGRIVSLLGN